MICIILGDVGSGKTAGLTWFGHSYYDEGYTLVSNYNLFNIDYVHLKDYNDLLKIEGESEDKPLFFMLDEGWLMADSRRSGSVLNMGTTKFGMQHRKKHAHVFITSQTQSQIDKRLKSQCQIWYEPEILAKDENGKPLYIKMEYKMFKGKRTIEGFIPMPMQYNFLHGFVDIPESYDTYEIVEDSEIDLEETYRPVIEKYIGVASTLKKGQLTSVLEIQEGIQSNIAEKLADFMKAQVILYELDMERKAVHDKKKKKAS